MASEEQNLQLVQGFYASFLDGTLFNYISENFTDDVEYTVITPTLGINNPSDYADDKFTHERQAAVPFTGLKTGIPDIKDFFAELLQNYDVLDFKTDKYIVEGDNVSVFGGLTYRNKATGNRADLLPFAVDIEVRDGKIDKYSFYEDSYSFAATARQGGEWTRIWDGIPLDIAFGTNSEDTLTGGSRSDLIYGYQSNDILNGGEGSDTLWGGSGDDALNGGGGDDTFYGNKGKDIFTGGSGNDLFVLASGEEANIITDFVAGEDKLGLAGSLTKEQLTIAQNGSSVEISITDSGETLAALTGVAVGDINESEFDLIPNAERTTAENVQLAEGFFNSFIDGSFDNYIEANFHPNVEYTVVGTEGNLFGTEREAILTHSGLYEGIDGAKYFFDLTSTERTVLSFDIHEVIGEGDSVAAFGSFRYLSPKETGGSGDVLETEWAVQMKILDGKVYRYNFFEDSYAVGAGYRHKDEGISWRRESDGEIRDITTGSSGDDTIDQSQSSNVNLIFGYGGNDNLAGGTGNDNLAGGTGNDNLAGGTGNDLFVLAAGEGTDTITDFEEGQDQLGLSLGLTFEQLEFTQNASDVEISIADTDEQLATLKGVENIVLDESDFKTFPSPTGITEVVAPGTPGYPEGYFVKADPFGEVEETPSLNEEENVRVVEGLFNTFIDGNSGTYVANNFHPDVQFTVAGSESNIFGAERKAVLPHTGQYEGIEGVQSFFELLDTEREVVSFNVDEVFSLGDSVAAFGTYEYLSPEEKGGSGDVLGTKWAARIQMAEEDGKPLVYRYYFYEDTAALAAGYRHKFEDSPKLDWNREFGGKDQNYSTGTTSDDTLEGKESPSDIRNRIFGYEGNDSLIGKSGNDFLYGGSGNDTLDADEGNNNLYGGEGDDILTTGTGDDNLYGNKGNDNLTGGAGKDIFVLGKGEGSDTINDFVDGEDRLGLLGLLTFEDLEITQDEDSVEISIAGAEDNPGELLATLQGVTASSFTEADFTDRSDSGAEIIPRRDLVQFPEFGFSPDYPVVDYPLTDISPSIPDEVQNRQVVQGFYASFLDGTLFDYISENFTEDVEYTVITPTLGINNPSDYSDDTFTHERQALVPFTGLKTGIPDIKDFFAELQRNYDVLDFKTDKYVVEGNNVSVFGGLTYRNKATGNRADLLPFAVNIELRDGKIAKYSFYEDSFSFAATARQGGEWTRLWNYEAKDADIAFGTNSEDTLTGGSRSDLIYGYQSDDALSGGEGSDTLWGGGGNDILNGGSGDDTFYGNEGDNLLTGGGGADQFWIANIEFPQAVSTITDFELGVDVLGIGGGNGSDLNEFSDLTLTADGDGTNTIISGKGQNLAVLLGIQKDSLSASNFVFVV